MCGPAQRELKAFSGFAARSEIRRVSAPRRTITNVGPYQEQKNASPEGWVRILSRDYAISFGSVEVNCREDDHFKINAMTESRSSLQTLADLFAVGTLIAKRFPQSGRIEARSGLRMMPTFPRSSLSFRTAGVREY